MASLRFYHLRIFSVLTIMFVAGTPNSASSTTENTLRIAIPNKIGTLNPYDTITAQDNFILQLIYDPLLLVDPEGNIKPALAQKWHYDPKSSRLYVKLHEDRRFSDGTLVGPSDVIRSFEALCSKKSRVSGNLFGLTGCGTALKDNVREEKDHSVSFQISIDPTAFLYQLAFGRALITKTSEKSALLGSGPYKIESRTKHQLELVPNPHSAVRNRSSKVTFVYFSEEELETGLKSHVFDLASMYLTSTAAKINAPNYTELHHALTVTQALVLNPGKFPFDKELLRKAIQTEIYNSTKLMRCVPGARKARGIIPAGIGGTVAHLSPSTLTRIPPSKVFQVYPDLKSLKIPVTLVRHQGRANACEEMVLKEIFAKFNLLLNIEHHSDYSTLIPKYLDPNTLGYIELFVFPSRDASTVLRRFTPGTKEPFYFYTKSQYLNKLKKALSLPTLTARYKHYRALNEEIIKDASTIGLYYIGHVNFLRRCIKDLSAAGERFNPNSFLYILDLQKPIHCGS